MEVAVESRGPHVLKTSLPDIGNLASWSVSSCKYGFNVNCLRDGDPNTYWQSDGPQPHYVTMQFQKKVAVQVIILVYIMSIIMDFPFFSPQKLAVYLNYQADDSYTPTKLLIRAGTGLHDLQDIKVVSMDQPQGWIQFDVGLEPANEEGTALKPLHLYVLQMLIAANHQNGKDTHVRGLVALGPKELPYTDEDQIPFKNVLFKMHECIR
ncbi:anaphase promoting complex subunit doc1 [Tulasnella sp. 418]|nr:anaphase promoting complex subunit doc1 [Tulasnella sp. 418]